MLNILFTHYTLAEYTRLRRVLPRLPMDAALNLACLTVIAQLRQPVTFTGMDSAMRDYDERTLEYRQ